MRRRAPTDRPGIRDPKLPSELKLAGHEVSRVASRALVTEAIKSGKIDGVIVDADDAAPLTREMEGSVSKPIVLPVMAAKPTKAAQDACRAAFGDRCELKASDKPEEFLRVIDGAIRARLKARKVQKG